MITNGVIFIWTGTNASIPAGWSRVTDLDDRFPKGNLDGLTNPNVTGGALTHTHTGTSHNHTMASHTHTTSYAPSNNLNSTLTESGNDGAENGHTHIAVTSSGPVNVSVSSSSVTYSSVSNNPNFYTVIYITPSTTAGGIPNLSVGLSDDSSFVNNTGKYNGYYNCDGNNSTPNLTQRYLAGASTGANAGTTGGSQTNSHTLTHTHTVSHNHSDQQSGTVTPATITVNRSGSGSDCPTETHTHNTSYSSTNTDTSDSPSTSTPENVEPAYKALLAIQNRSLTTYTPVGIIGLWLGTLANIPQNFEIVSSMYDRHLKIGSVVGDIGVTGGSNTHTHASSSHTHNAISHTHTISVANHSSTSDNSGSAPRTSLRSHGHPGSSATSVNAVLDSANTSADSSSNEPEYRTVAFIKYKGETGGSFIFNIL